MHRLLWWWLLELLLMLLRLLLDWYAHGRQLLLGLLRLHLHGHELLVLRKLLMLLRMVILLLHVALVRHLVRIGHHLLRHWLRRDVGGNGLLLLLLLQLLGLSLLRLFGNARHGERRVKAVVLV